MQEVYCRVKTKIVQYIYHYKERSLDAYQKPRSSWIANKLSVFICVHLWTFLLHKIRLDVLTDFNA